MIRTLFLLLAFLGLLATARADEQDDQLAKQLVSIVRDPRHPLRPRVEAAKMLGKLGPRAAAAVPELIAEVNRLKGAELELLQESVIEALGSIGSAARTALPTLAKASGRTMDIDQSIKRASEALLAAADGRDLSLLLQQLGSRDSSVRMRAAKALGLIGPPAEPALLSLSLALTDPDGDVRRTAFSAIRRIQPDAKISEDMVKAILLDLKDPDPDIRLLAIRALSRMGKDASSAIGALQEAANDPDRDVKKAAIEALSRLAAP